MSTEINRRFFRSAASLAAAAVFAVPAARASDFDDPPGSEPRSDEGVLELLPGVDVQAILDRYPGFVLLDSIPSRNIHLVAYRTVLTDDEFELLFVGDADIDHSELNFDSGNAGPSTGSLFFNVAPSSFNEQPVWDDINLNAAHASATGAGTTIAFIDTGLDTTIPMFAGRIHPAAISFIGSPANYQDLGNGADDDGDLLVDELLGHGTWVAGLACTVAPDALLMPIRALSDEGYTNAFTLTKALYHAIDNGANVINLSLGSVAQVRIVERAVDDASALGIIVVAAAGNQGVGIPEFPAGNNKSAGVAAVTLDGVAADFTNYTGDGGGDLLLCAPGVDIVGPLPGGYGLSSGTSAAVPLVSGAAALLIEAGKVRRFDDFEAMAARATLDVRPQNAGLPDGALGEGMLDLGLAMAWAGPCFADLAEDGASAGVLDLADIQAFITGFTIGDDDVDYVEPRGVWDLADVQFFLASFVAGCP